MTAGWRENSIILPLGAFLNILPLWMVVIILIRDFAITTLRAYADYKNSSFPTSNYAKWKTFLQMSFLYYLLIIYVGQNTVELYKGNEKIFSLLLHDQFIYFIMLFITAITFHSGVTYIYKNRHLIKKLFEHKT
jgi:CDP-diacylglycerol--glycerol-3-phosphate 3-phosphatidyltransferase